MHVMVLGAGIAGCTAALAFARGGHEVVVLDRGDMPSFDGWSADDVFQQWQRRGIGQFRQPHNFLGLARAVLRDRFADVYAAVLKMGATEVNQASFLGNAEREVGDENRFWRTLRDRVCARRVCLDHDRRSVMIRFV